MSRKIYTDALMDAYMDKDLNTMKCLIRLGADTKDIFYKIIDFKQEEMILLLAMENKSDFNLALSYASEKKNIEVLYILMGYYSEEELKSFNIALVNDLLYINDETRSEHSIDSYSSIGDFEY